MNLWRKNIQKNIEPLKEIEISIALEGKNTFTFKEKNPSCKIITLRQMPLILLRQVILFKLMLLYFKKSLPISTSFWYVCKFPEISGILLYLDW